MMFADTEVILDNAAGRSIFRNRDLLHDIVNVKRRSIDGVNSKGPSIAVTEQGLFEDLRVPVSISDDAVANILSFGLLEEAGFIITRELSSGDFIVSSDTRDYRFSQKVDHNGRRMPYWVCDMALDSAVTDKVLIATVQDGLRRLTKREVKNAQTANLFMERMGHMAPGAAARALNRGVHNLDISASDVRNSVAVHGASIAAMRGKTTKQKSAIVQAPLAPLLTQVQQVLDIDLFFLDGLTYILGVMSPLGLLQCCHLNDKGLEEVRKALKKFLSKAKERNFEIRIIRADNEGAIAAMTIELNDLGVMVELAGPGQHVAVVERMIRTVKERYRCYVNTLPYLMTTVLRKYCVFFCVRSLNLQPNSQSIDGASPWEQYSGMKLDYKRDLRVGFGDYVEATVKDTDNTSAARTEGCIALLPTGRLSGSVWFHRLSGGIPVVRDQFRVLPMPVHVVQHLTKSARQQGYRRVAFAPPPAPLADQEEQDRLTALPTAPDMMQVAPPTEVTHEATEDTPQPSESGVDVPAGDAEAETDDGAVRPVETEVIQQPQESTPPAEPPPLNDPQQTEALSFGGRWSDRLNQKRRESIVMFSKADRDRAEVRRQLEARGDWRDSAYAFKISVKAALRERGNEARPVIMAELQQMVDKGVWHAVDTKGLSHSQRKSIIRSSMFLKDKYLADGTFEKFKARLVAGGDQQDKTLYDNLSSPTAATASVLSVAAMAAAENRHVYIFDVTGAYLNASMKETGVTVHMRLDRTMTTILCQIDPLYKQYVEPTGTIVVQLDKALYGCVEAAALWFKHLSAALIADGFTANPYDSCVFNKTGEDGVQITIVLHVDDLMVTSASLVALEAFKSYLSSVYNDVKCTTGKVVNYVGMTFDFSVPGEVSVTMENCINDILSECGVTVPRPTPATDTLFEVREGTPLVPEDMRKRFHTYVAKMLYLSKRVRPECLPAVGFLSTRVQCCDIDDYAKLERLLGYLLGSRDRGIILRVGPHMSVKAYIDAAYGVHSNGKSHTGCAIVLGDGGPVFAKSAKQKIVTKSSTEAELVGLSDTASQAIHLRNFVLAQGYEVGPAIIYQDNLSCMALMKRGGPASERSRHINIRHFWLRERVDGCEVVVEHLGTEKMFANALTKPVQGTQFVLERRGLTNWD